MRNLDKKEVEFITSWLILYGAKSIAVDDFIRLAGKNKALDLYQALCSENIATRHTVSIREEVLEQYQKQVSSTK